MYIHREKEINGKWVSAERAGTMSDISVGGGSIYEYDLSTPYDLTTIGVAANSPTIQQSSTPKSKTPSTVFNSDGTKMFIADEVGGILTHLFPANGIPINASPTVTTIANKHVKYQSAHVTMSDLKEKATTLLLEPQSEDIQNQISDLQHYIDRFKNITASDYRLVFWW